MEEPRPEPAIANGYVMTDSIFEAMQNFVALPPNKPDPHPEHTVPEMITHVVSPPTTSSK